MRNEHAVVSPQIGTRNRRGDRSHFLGHVNREAAVADAWCADCLHFAPAACGDWTVSPAPVGPLAPIHAVTETLRGSDHSCASSAIDNGRNFEPSVETLAQFLLQ